LYIKEASKIHKEGRRRKIRFKAILIVVFMLAGCASYIPMSNFFWGLVIFAIILAVIIVVGIMLKLRKAIRAFKELVSVTENSLKSTVAELQETLKSVRNVADNATVVSGDMKVRSGALRDIGENVKRVSGDVKHLVDFVDEMTSSAVVEASGLKAGAWYFIKNFSK
jgi:hypothetical protein